MGTKPRTPEHFPHMRYRARKRDETREARESCQVGCFVIFDEAWRLMGELEVTE